MKFCEGQAIHVPVLNPVIWVTVDCGAITMERRFTPSKADSCSMTTAVGGYTAMNMVTCRIDQMMQTIQPAHPHLPMAGLACRARQRVLFACMMFLHKLFPYPRHYAATAAAPHTSSLAAAAATGKRADLKPCPSCRSLRPQPNRPKGIAGPAGLGTVPRFLCLSQ
jgi:hypothetical protein